MQTDPRDGHRRSSEGARPGELLVDLAADSHAPYAARMAVAVRLGATVAAPVLERVQLIASELVTNSVRHSRANSDDRLTLRVEATHGAIRVEVEDPGRGAAIAVRPLRRDSEDGFGLNIVQSLSRRWGSEHDAAHGTRAWAELGLAPAG